MTSQLVMKMTSQLVIFRAFLFIFFRPPTLGLKKKSRKSANKKIWPEQPWVFLYHFW